MLKTVSPKRRLSKSEIAAELAERVGLSKKQVIQLLEAQAALAYEEARNVFTIPGVGRLTVVERPARKMTLRFGPDKGKEKMLSKRKRLRFTAAKAAIDAILTEE